MSHRTVLPLKVAEHLDDFFMRWCREHSQPKGHVGADICVQYNLTNDFYRAECDRISNVITSQELLKRNPTGPVADRIRSALRDELLPESVRFEIECLEAGITGAVRQPLAALNFEVNKIIEQLQTATVDREALLDRFEVIQAEQAILADALDELLEEIEQLRNRYL